MKAPNNSALRRFKGELKVTNEQEPLLVFLLLLLWVLLVVAVVVLNPQRRYCSSW